jgi:site-specific recombinase XerD
LRSWEAASDRVRDWEAAGKVGVVRREVPSITDAVAAYLLDCQKRLKAPSVKKYRTLLEKHLLGFCEVQGFRSLDQLTVSALREFRNGWEFAPVSQVKNLECLRSFMRFCAADGWITGNPAASIKAPQPTFQPTLPLSDAEFEKLIRASDRYSGNGAKIRALLLLMRYSGLRISDAVTLKRSEVKNGRVLLYQAKTGTPVHVPVPPLLLKALHKIENGGEFYFWSGNGKVKSAIEDCRRTLSAVAKLADVEKVHFHRLRDTFAVSLLQRGVSLEEVSVLLGHSSIKVTERHYAPWVKARQQRLEAAVKRAWA